MKHPSEAFDFLSGLKLGTGYVWPTAEQEWMLRAAIMPGQAGSEAWNKWISSVDIDHLDAGSFRLIPLLYRNLRRIGVEHELLGRFKGIHRKAWYENQMALHRLAGLLNFLHDAGIPTLILKGAALALLYYHDLGLRPMTDIDVLVPINKAIDTIELLRGSGWKPIAATPRNISADFLLATKACNLVRHESDPQLDLHWHVFQECLDPDADLDLWDSSVPVLNRDVETRALSSADQFLHICVHGMEWNVVAPMRWVADAMIVLSETPDLDWERVLQQARKRGFILVLQIMLLYLRSLVDAPIPSHVIEQLQSLPVTQIERDWMKIRTRGISQLTVRDLFKVRFGLYKRSALSAHFHPKCLGFPRYMQLIWGMDHWWELPQRGVRTVLNRLMNTR
jgi:hypothetical protein